MTLLTSKETMEVMEILDQAFPDAKTELEASNDFEMLVATILSAQCTDVRVNKTTKELFPLASSPEEMLELGFDRLKEIIRPCGFYNMKAKNIIGTSEIILNKYGGRVPDTMEELIDLPGVGRKTANVVLSNCFGQDAIAVDTHVFRVSNRLGICDETDVDKTEKCLMGKIQKSWWTHAHMLLIFQGRRVCSARSPKCDQCQVIDYCNYYKEISEVI